MLGLFSSSEKETTDEEDSTLSKSILPPDDREMYETQYEKIRENLQSLNTSVKMRTNVEGINVPSASHNYSDLKDLIFALERVEKDLRENHDIVMVTDKIWMARYCIHLTRSIQDKLEIEAEVQDD